MRSCEEFEKLLPAYVAGVAAPQDIADIGEHLAECSPCMNDFQRVVRDLGTLKSWRDPMPPEGLAARVLEKLASSEEQHRREALGEEAAWGEPVQRALTWVMLGAVGVVVLATLVTAQSASWYENKRRQCANNLHHIGEAATSAGELDAPLERHLEDMPKGVDRELLTCPLAPSLLPAQYSSYNLRMRGPHFLAGDRRENHSGDPRGTTWGPDANILLSDGSVISVTPAQAGLWELLDLNSPGR